ncbi:MAG: hypothetical protein FWC15_02005 [Fibromonadales bacterium]|nr:hypothetical protein [Fibromonadales bacterium]
MKKVATLLFLLAFCASAQEVKDSSIVNIEQKSLALTIVSWPFVYIIQPTVEFLIYPVIPPLIYISRENLIEKGYNLITFGENKQIMFYPTINAKIGSQANIGFAYWHSNLLLDKDNIFVSPHLYVNSDWDVTLRYKKKEVLGKSIYWGLNASYREDGDNSFRNTKEGKIYSYADSSVFSNSFIGFNLIKNWDLEFGTAFNFHRFDLPNLNDSVFTGDDVSVRGFYQNYQAFPLTLSLQHNSLDAPYAATKGRIFSLGYTYIPVSRYNGTIDHNYHVIESRLVNYTLLGNRSYTMTVAESNTNREKLRNITFTEAIEILNPINIKEEVLDRRVFITQLRMRYMLEENDGKAPFTAMSRLGGNFPLRAYADGYFTAPLVAGISTEYRWPIDRFADAVIFNEYGIYGDGFSDLSTSNIRNSYGFGFRIRTPKLFITRVTLAFHGLQGVAFILTTKPEFN